jgi:hypothetical protein
MARFLGTLRPRVSPNRFERLASFLPAMSPRALISFLWNDSTASTCCPAITARGLFWKTSSWSLKTINHLVWSLAEETLIEGGYKVESAASRSSLLNCLTAKTSNPRWSRATSV